MSSFLVEALDFGGDIEEALCAKEIAVPGLLERPD
jgi:hypothetical protein